MTLKRGIVPTLLFLGLALSSASGIPSVDEWVTTFSGSPLYPSQSGKPGWPGMVTNQVAPAPWGFPERIPYPGSVEHVRVELQRYIPVVPLYNARTLIKRFAAAELPGMARERVRDYAEPIYSVPKYEDAKPTGEFNKPVQVVAWDTNSPPIELDLGTLKPGTYVVRLIAATPTEFVERSSKRLVISCAINDGLAGEVTPYRKRCAAIDEFYSIMEFFFHAPETRVYTAKLSIDPSTVLPVVLLHAIDVHNKLAQLACKAGKTGASFYDPEQRLAGWKEKGTYKPDSRTPEQRLEDDGMIWNSAMPVNGQPYGSEPQGTWLIYAQAAPLMLPPEAKDDGMGLDFYGKDLLWNRPADYIESLKKLKQGYSVNTALAFGKHRPALTRQTAYVDAIRLSSAYNEPYRAVALAKQYHETGDEAKARQAAIRLARLGLQNLTHGLRQTMMAYDIIPMAVHGDIAFRRRYKEMDYGKRGYFDAEGDCFVTSYDQLFPYIQNNAELAQSLGRFIPWIKTPADARRFYETYILQYYAHQVMTYNAFLGSPTPGWMANVMAVQQDPEIIQPWAEWLFRYAWVYPNRPMGVDEIAVNAITRDGTNKKGSTFYTWGGSELSTVLACLDLCKAAGLKLPVDMSDRNRFPKAYWGTRFKDDISVAGGYAFYIGDVSGPTRTRLQDLGAGLRKTPEKIPNNPSRVLSAWAGILEAGREQADFKRRRAAGVRVGSGYGHAHHDTFDLQIWAQGVPMCGDSGGREGYGVPTTSWLGNHNTVLSDLASGHQWVSSFAPLDGAQYMKAALKCPGLYERQVALIDADADNSYVVDVFRVKGGAVPSYAFHGMPADQFEVNALDRRPAELDRFLPEASKWSGTCPETLTATWRMRRDPETITWTNKAGVKGELGVPGAERIAQGPDFDEQAPRKFIRLHMPGRAGDEAYGARSLCLQATPHAFDNLYIKPRDWAGETVFVGVYEPFAGEGFIKSVRLLTPAASLTNTAEAVVVEVLLRNGRRDVVCLAPRESPATSVEGLTARGEFALASFDEKGVVQAALAGGTQLKAGKLALTTERPAYEGVIKTLDYVARTAEFSQPLPAEASNAVIEVGCPAYRTSYTLAKADGTQVVFLKGMDYAMSRVLEFTPEGLPVLQGSISIVPGMAATDDSGKTLWRLAGARDEGVELTGGPLPRETLKEGDALRVWEIGPGDPYRLPVQVKVTRRADGSYKSDANAPVKIDSGI